MKLFLLSIAAVLVVFPVFAQSWTQLNPHDDLFSSTIFATTVDKTGKVYAAAKAADGSNRYVVSVLSSGSWDPVGGVQALVSFYGLTPGVVGLTQVNYLIPAGVAPGPQPVVVTVGGVASQAATIEVTARAARTALR